MNRKEAIIAMANGKKVKHSTYNYGNYVYLDGYKFLFYDSSFNDSELLRLALKFEDGYEIYKPKVKRKIEVWVNVYKDYISTWANEEQAMNVAKPECLAVAVKLEKEIEVEG